MFFHSTFLLAVSASILNSVLGDDSADKTSFRGDLSTMDGGLSGTVIVQDPKTLLIKNYELKEASAPALYWWGSTTNSLRSGFRISEQQVSETSDGEDLQILLDSGKTTADFTTVGLWCERFGVNFGQATLKRNGGLSASGATSTAASSQATPASRKTNEAKDKESGVSFPVRFTPPPATMNFAVLLLV